MFFEDDDLEYLVEFPDGSLVGYRIQSIIGGSTNFAPINGTEIGPDGVPVGGGAGIIDEMDFQEGGNNVPVSVGSGGSGGSGCSVILVTVTLINGEVQSVSAQCIV